MDDDQDQMELKSVEVYDPVQNRHYNVYVPGNIDILQSDEIDDDHILSHVDHTQESATIWSQNETLALINIFSLHKDKFKHFKMKKDRWKLISRELAKIGIEKLPVKCEIKWRNLIRTYRSYKITDKAQGKFEFYNEIDDIVTSDPQLYKSLFDSPVTLTEKMISRPTEVKQMYEDNDGLTETHFKKRKCSTCKSEKQKRHAERMVLLQKKLDIEERKVKAFEDYIKFLKSTHQPNS